MEILKIKRSAFDRLIKEKRLKAYDMGGRDCRFRRGEVEFSANPF